MSDEDTANVVALRVTFKTPTPADRTLVLPYEVGKSQCQHYPVHCIVNTSLAEVTCAECGEKLNPMWVLGQLATRDRYFAEAHKRYHEQMERLSERTSTKCRHCGKMTRISKK